MQMFQYINNKLIFFGSWIGGGVFGVALLPRTTMGSPAFIACLTITIICFFLFAWQAMTALGSYYTDAAHGAALRQQEEDGLDSTISPQPRKNRASSTAGFDHINKPILVLSWLGGAIFGMGITPRLEAGTPLHYICQGITFIFAILFAWQCMKSFFGVQADAARGAKDREDQESEDKRRF